MNTSTKENKMGVMPIPKLLITMALPIILSMLVQALYNIVDSMFVSRINENALSAVSLAFPIQNLLIAIATGTGVGINAMLSRHLGEGNAKAASEVAKNGVFLAVMSYIVVAVLGILGSRFFFTIQTQDSQLIEYGTQYLSVIMICSFGVFIQITFERLLQATGKTLYTMATQGIGAIINIILDPILIFGIGPFPKMGVTGAAVATVIGQIIAACLAIFFNLKKNDEIHLSVKGFHPSGKIVKQIYAVGIPSILMVAIGSVMTFGINKILLGFTSTATAVFGVYFKLQSFIFMPIFGLNNGMVPIIAYNYGAKNKKRITATIKLSVTIATSIMLIGLILFQVFPAVFLGMFNASSEMLEIGIPALRIISISFIFAGYCIILGSVFQALGNGMYSLIISVARQLVVILPAAYILSKVFGLHAVWWSIPLAEVISVVMSSFLLGRIYNQKLKNL